MKNIKTNLLIVLFAALLFACNSKENKTNAPQNKIADKSAKSEKSTAIDSPCDVISKEEVISMFEITEYPVEMKDVVYTYPTCIFKWEDGKIITSVSFGGQEIKSTRPSEVLIVMVKNANEDMFKKSTSVYKQPEEISNMGSKWKGRSK